MATTKRIRRNREHHETVLCACGCGQYFDAQYTTRKPRYVNKKHKNKANNVTRIKTREARISELWEIRKRAVRIARAHMKANPQAFDFPGPEGKKFKARALAALTARFASAIKRGQE